MAAAPLFDPPLAGSDALPPPRLRRGALVARRAAATAPPPPGPYRFTVDDYYRMARVGILQPEWRTELLDGQVVVMSPIGSPHAAAVRRVQGYFQRTLGERALIDTQNPVRLDNYSEPQPDVTLLRPRADLYEDSHPTAEDIFLVVEIADTSYARDVAKLALYARLGVPEVWIADLARDRLRVDRSPEDGVYADSRMLTRGNSIAPLAFPDLQVRVEDILGDRPRGTRRGQKAPTSG